MFFERAENSKSASHQKFLKMTQKYLLYVSIFHENEKNTFLNSIFTMNMP